MQLASWRRIAALAAAVALLPLSGALAPASASTTITVNSLGVAEANDGTCTLPEAIGASNDELASGAASGECPAGTPGADWIDFTVAGTINLTDHLPEITDDLTIAGGARITLKGDATSALVYVTGGTANVTLDQLTFTGGKSGYGGAIFVDAGSLTLSRSLVTGNEATSEGGGLAAAGGIVVIDRSTFSNNTTGLEGGGLTMNTPDGELYVYRSTFSGNQSGLVGGAIASESPVWLANTTIAGNHAGNYTGGLYLNGAPAGATIENVTISGNTADHPDQGGTGIDATSSATVVVRNSIIAGNSAPDAAQIDTSTHSIVNAGVTGILDPAGLQWNGGPTKTVRLLPTATAAIGQGDPAVCDDQYVVGIDQRGVERPAGTGCDIGATERETVKPTMTGTPKPGLRTGVALGGSSLRGYLPLAASDGTGGSGVVAYEVWRSTNGGAWTKVSTVSSATAPVTLAKGRSYRFRVRAIDGDRNVSTYAVSPTFGARLVQAPTSLSAGSWSKRLGSSYSGGSTWSATKAGSSVRLTATGRAFALVSTLGPTRGKAKIFVDGSLAATIDLYAPTTTYRVQAWSRRFSSARSHTIRVVVVGTAGRPRVDVDAFGVLR